MRNLHDRLRELLLIEKGTAFVYSVLESTSHPKSMDVRHHVQSIWGRYHGDEIQSFGLLD
jgi:hypothetical protein